VTGHAEHRRNDATTACSPRGGLVSRRPTGTTRWGLCWHGTNVHVGVNTRHPGSGTPCDDPDPWMPHPDQPAPAWTGGTPFEGVWPGNGTRTPGATRPDNGQPWSPPQPAE
jgi:hypothetical protein